MPKRSRGIWAFTISNLIIYLERGRYYTSPFFIKTTYMELDGTRIRTMLTKEKVDEIETLIEDKTKEVEISVFEEIKEILDRTFGKQNNQIVKPTLENIIERNAVDLFNSYRNLNEQKSISTLLNQNGVFHIVIRFPEITITNGKGESHVIKDLFVRIGLHPSGKLAGEIQGLRATLTLQEVSAGYFHSHLPGMNIEEELSPSRHQQGDTIENFTGGVPYGTFCLGEGPIIQVLTQLKVKYNKNVFQLFCLHLKSYVAWESLEGTPYMEIRGIDRSDKSKRRHSQSIGRDSVNIIAKHIVYKILKNPEKYDITSMASIIVSDNKISLVENTASKRFIGDVLLENRTEIFRNRAGWEAFCIVTIIRGSYFVPLCYDKHIQEDEDHEYEHIINSADRTLLTFKGEEIKLKLEKTNENNQGNETEETLYAHPSILSATLSEISRILTEKAREIRRADIYNSTC
jgi:hypothetical protein